jgi:flagellar hook-length control protein FliK
MEIGMDALSLVSPASVVVNPGSNGGTDTSATDSSSATATVDFAALLAAGMLPAQPPVDAAARAAVPATGVDADDAQSLQGALKNAPANMAVPLHAALGGQAASAKEGELDAAPATGERFLALGGAAGSHAPIAADAATFAAHAAAHASGIEAGEARLIEARWNADGGASADVNALAAHALQMAAAEKAAQPQPVAHLEITAPVDTPDFAQALSQQVVWMADKDAQVAELRINPPELGPVEVRLTLSGDQAAVQFTSAHAEVRNVLEAAIGRMRETMAEAGIALGQTSVSAESFRDQGAGQSDGREARGGTRGDRGSAEPAWSPAPSVHTVRRGLVDLFA